MREKRVGNRPQLTGGAGGEGPQAAVAGGGRP